MSKSTLKITGLGRKQTTMIAHELGLRPSQVRREGLPKPVTKAERHEQRRLLERYGKTDT